MSKLICEVCKEEMGTFEYSVCDSCEAEYCIKHIKNNICPICKGEHSE